MVMVATVFLATLPGVVFRLVDGDVKASFGKLSAALRVVGCGAQADGTGSAQVSRHESMEVDGRFVMRPAPEGVRATSVYGHGARSRRCASGRRSKGMVRAG